MKKIIFLLTILLTFSASSQFKRNSVEVAGGVNNHVSPLGNAGNGLHFNGLYRYNITPKFGLGLMGSYDKLDHNTGKCQYDTQALNLTPEVFYRFLQRNNWSVLGHTGVGVSKLGTETLLNYVVGGTLLRRITNNLSAKVGYMGTSYVYQENALDQTTLITSNGINSYTNQIFAGIAYQFGKGKTHADYFKSQSKPEVIREIEIRTEKETIIREIVESQVQRNAIPNEFLFFKEGKTDIQSEGYASIARIRQFMLLNPEYYVTVVGTSCGGHGTFERNLQLSKERAKNVADQLISLGVPANRVTNRGLGVDKVFEHKDQHFQKRVELILYKTSK